MIGSRVSTPIAILALLSWTAVIAVAQHDHGGGGHQEMDHQGVGHEEHATMHNNTGSLKSKVLEVKEGVMVVEGKHEGKVQRLNIRTDHETKIEGPVEPGSEVTIDYREEAAGLLYAKSIKGARPKKN